MTYEAIEKLAFEVLELVPSSDEEITKNEILFLDFVLLDNYVYTEEFSARVIDYDDKKLIKSLFSLVKTYFIDNELEEPTEKALSIFVFYLRNIILLSKISPLFQKNFFEINSSVQKNHGNMMASWYEIIKNSKVAALKRLKYLDDIIVNLTMFTLYLENVKISKKNSGKTAKTHVLFSFDGKTAYLNYLQIFARNILETSHTKITFLSNQRIDNAYIRRFKVDILVKNYKDNYEHFDCPTYTCSRQPTTKDWDKVSQYISDFEG